MLGTRVCAIHVTDRGRGAQGLRITYVGSLPDPS